jgi:hypothetical protein
LFGFEQYYWKAQQTQQKKKKNRMASLEELKGAVKDALESRGVLDELRAAVRAEVFRTLNEGDAAKPRPEGDTWLLNELVREYLTYHGLRHTLAVFLPGLFFFFCNNLMLLVVSDRYSQRLDNRPRLRIARSWPNRAASLMTNHRSRFPCCMVSSLCHVLRNQRATDDAEVDCQRACRTNTDFLFFSLLSRQVRRTNGLVFICSSVCKYK